ncbi:hypothetical protein [Myxococcus sp. AS-1-15]|jgi:hypothetical protein|uniref:hypothetical protein n=1 Tax=Myxococcus sp. AS-1-15 TaxID=2874600 RepID=UPI001CC0FA20|nr:hypothetical protein [Myxococcus sp. AS-1-15]MBZ4396701.1 hypothetical protein [Myxococcus sp. AS-1-15]
MKADSFADRLQVAVTLTAGGTPHVIPPGDVKSFALTLRSFGFEGRVAFDVADNTSAGGLEKDPLKAAFLEQDLMEVQLELTAVHTDAAPQPALTSLKVKGLVSERSLVEVPAAPRPGAPLLHRRYEVTFQDAAALLWSQHFPCVLYTQKTMKDVLDAHKGTHIPLVYDWSAGLDATCPQLFLGLTPEHGASFYDFLLWYVDTRDGVLAYDYTAAKYKLSAAKAAEGTPVKLWGPDVDQVTVRFPEVPRHEVTVLNAVAEGPATRPINQQSAVTGIRHDVLLRTPITNEVDARVTLETARLKVRGKEVELGWKRFPATALVPGSLVKLPTTEAWAAAGLAGGETFRVRTLALRGDALASTPDAEHLSKNGGFEFQMATLLEPQAEKWVDLPPYLPPTWPRYVEGLIVSEMGDEPHETWQAYTDSKTSQDGYKVKIPLWANQIVTLPFNPNLLPGHFYFPAYKGERVLVGLDFQKAWLKRFLDWRDTARMPADGQGTHLLVGKTPENGTSMKHSYVDGKPVFLLQRTNAKDTARIEIKEGTLVIRVKEEPA